MTSGKCRLNSRMREFDPEMSENERYSRRRRMRIPPRMLSELFMSSETDDALTSLLLLAGFLREDFPWLAELMSESYREIRDGEHDEIERIIYRLRRTIKQLMRSPMMREISGTSKDAMVMAEELPFLLDMVLENFIGRTAPLKAVESDETEE